MRKDFSIVVPVAPGRNAEILESLKNLQYSRQKFEVIVKSGPNASKNRNEGAKYSKGEFIVFLDDDARVDGDYLERLKIFLEKNKGVDMVGGPQLTKNETESFFGKISGLALTSFFGAFRVNRRYCKKGESFCADEDSLTSANLVVRRSVFDEIGFFNENLFPGEDPEFISRAKRAKKNIAYSPDIVIYHKRRENLQKFIRQFYLYGLVRPKKNKITKDLKVFYLVPMLFTIYFLFIPTLSLVNILFLSPLLAYILLALIFAAYDSINGGSVAGIFLLPAIYLLMHLSYGLGMLSGYFKR